MIIKLRKTKTTDLPFVISTEGDKENSIFVSLWTLEQHQDALQNPDLAHLIIEKVNENKPLGYIILAGISDEAGNIEFRRIVTVEKGIGIGKASLELIKTMAFEQLNAHRLWLDVKEFNHRARHVYKNAGFTEEGILRECLKTDTGRKSLVLMSILKNEYLGKD
jgi:diamine N-acetyltransferase